MRWCLVLVAVAACGAASERELLLGLRDTGDRPGMRGHGWRTWAEIATDPPAWDRWTPSEQIFGEAPPGGRPRLRTPRPFRIGDTLETEQLPVMFDVLFDPAAEAHIRTHGLAKRAVLARLARVPEFPTDAVAVKLVWYPVHATGLTAMPIWDGDPVLTDNDGNPDRSWRRAVAVDPSRDAIPDGETTEVVLHERRFTARVVPLAAFVHRTLESDDELAAARRASGDPTLVRGDFIALVAAHVTTKQIPDWTWATFWWHDAPDEGEFADGRPASLPGPARNYLMDVALSTDGACFNPWLEARFPHGLGSNCMTCHQRAVVGATDYLPVTVGRLPPDDPYFAGHPPTDFVWSIALEAR